MQYVSRALGYALGSLTSINPSTLLGAIDVVVVEHPDGLFNCSPFHVRFGKFQLLRPSQKKVEVIINGTPTNLPMKLGDEGEAFFVFEATNGADIPLEMAASPVLLAALSPLMLPSGADVGESLNEPSELRLDRESPPPSRSNLVVSDPPRVVVEPTTPKDSVSPPTSPPTSPRLRLAHTLTSKLQRRNIPSKVDVNGDLLLDIDGYKSNSKNIQELDETLKQLLQDELGPDVDLSQLLMEEETGELRISGLESPYASEDDAATVASGSSLPTSLAPSHYYFRTLRLTSEQLQALSLNPGENDVAFSVNKGRAVLTAKLYLWKLTVPIVISDIDGTITKSDVFGHVLTMIGRDWTHVGVAQLFADISQNGYNIMYLTARGAGQADSTRAYLKGIDQDGFKLPPGPVILSPDRTMAALRREVILKKPEVFKIACLKDLQSLYDDGSSLEMQQESRPVVDGDIHPLGETGSTQAHLARHAVLHHAEVNTPFYAGFGNRITDALLYRSVGIPSLRIFTINPNGEVHMELLELAGFKSLYVNIGEIVDHFFPPLSNGQRATSAQFNDTNYWREPLPDLSDDEDESPPAGSMASLQQVRESSLPVGEDEDDEDDEDYESSADEFYDDDDYTDEEFFEGGEEDEEDEEGEEGDEEEEEGEDDDEDNSRRMVSPRPTPQ